MPALAARAALLLALAPTSLAWPDETAVLREVNHVRTAPAAYAARLRHEAASYQGRYRIDSAGAPVTTFEGAPAVHEAAAALDAQARLPPLLADPILRAAAREHVETQGRQGAIGHGSAGDTPGERVRRHGGDIYVAEVISYGVSSASEVVRQLVVDDGVAGRGHRRLLLTPFYRYAGIWCGPHASQSSMCVIDLAAGPGGRPHVPAQ